MALNLKVLRGFEKFSEVFREFQNTISYPKWSRMCWETLRSSQNRSPSLRYPSTPPQFSVVGEDSFWWGRGLLRLIAVASLTQTKACVSAMWLRTRHVCVHMFLDSLSKSCSSLSSLTSGTRKEPKPKLLTLDIFHLGRGLPREGVGAKKFGMLLETREIKHFWRDIPGCCRDIPELPEKFEKKKFVFNFRPLPCKP